MKPRNREINIFNLSMLDVICGALGAFLILFLIAAPYYDKKNDKKDETKKAESKEEKSKKDDKDKQKDLLHIAASWEIPGAEVEHVDLPRRKVDRAEGSSVVRSL